MLERFVHDIVARPQARHPQPPHLRKAAVAAAGSAAVASSSAYAAPNLNFNRQAGELNVMYLYVPFMEAILPQFEEETGITVNTVSTYGSNDEWWAKINAGEQTDFLIATTDWVQRAMSADRHIEAHGT